MRAGPDADEVETVPGRAAVHAIAAPLQPVVARGEFAIGETRDQSPRQIEENTKTGSLAAGYMVTMRFAAPGP